jgi:hypothetical protein
MARKTRGRDYMGTEKEPPQPHGPRVGGRAPAPHSHGGRKRGFGKRGGRKR